MVVVAGLLAACTGTSSAPESSTSASAVESAESGAVASYRSPKSNCYAEWNPDDTANVRLYNRLQTPGVKNFTLATSEDDNAILMENYEKKWENGGDGAAEGQYQCASVPYLVRNDGETQSFYTYDGSLWTGHPGWWGHTKQYSWNDSPKGWVRFKCNGKVKSGQDNIDVRTGCPDSALGSGYVEVPWNTQSEGNTLTAKPACTTTNPLIGCYTTSGHTGSLDGDFYFDTTAWTAPMRVKLTTDFQVADGVYLTWDVTEARVSSAEWSDKKSPSGQVVKRGSTLYVGAYATASNGAHTVNLTLRPKATIDAEGNTVGCRKNGQILACRSLDRTETVAAIAIKDGQATYTTEQNHDFVVGDKVTITGSTDRANDGTFTIERASAKTFTVKNSKAVAQTTPGGTVKFLGDATPKLGVDVSLSVAATLTLDGNPPKSTPTIECSTNAKTVLSKNLTLACAKAGSPFTYGGEWFVDIKN